MMNQSENHSEMEGWRKAFEGASEIPPASVWNAIEKHLDGEKEEVLPLWWKSRKLWTAAASVAMLVLGAWLMMPKWANQSTDLTLETNSSQGSSSGVSQRKQPSGTPIRDRSETKDDLVQGTDLSGEKRDQPFSIAEARVHDGRAKASKSLKVRGTAQSGLEKNFASSDPTTVLKDPVLGSRVEAMRTVSPGGDIAVPVVREKGIENFETLPAAGIRELDVFFQKRYVYFQPGAAPEVKNEKVAKSEKGNWIAMGVMPGSFNPHQEISPMPVSSLSMSSNKSSSSSHQAVNQAKLSFALQTQTGFKLSKHWSLETGVSYMKGNSNFMSDGVLRDLASRKTTNSLEAAYLVATQPQKPLVNEIVSGVAYVDVVTETINNYQYLQLPLQAGYAINPEGKVNLVVLGGVAANYFLKNEFGTASGTTHTNTTGNDIYRTLNWAGTTGLRINYELSSQWNLNLTGSYQQSLRSNFQENSGLKSSPQWYGVGWGVRYSF